MRRSSHRRCGFTLLEMMLVLGVIAAFAGMTLPSVLRMFGQQKLTASAERVREAIAGARVRAIESGIIYQFCCESNGGHFVVVPFEPDHVNIKDGSHSGGTPLLSRAWGLLPKGVIFSSVTAGIPGVAAAAQNPHKLTAEALDGLPNSGNLASVNWSSPILFNCDGSASIDTEITVSDNRSQHVKLRVRAFTGAVSMERLGMGK